MGFIKKIFEPAPHIKRLDEASIKKLYPAMRWRILESTFLGYALFYVVRNNLSTVSKEMGAALQYDHSMIGNILAVSAISYGLGKFVMGAVSDRSNPKTFMSIGLLLTAAVNFAFGGINSYYLHLALWSLNGFIQGMGWPPCGRSIGHWYSVRERGTVFAIWNISHNVGGGLAGVIAAYSAQHFGWQSAFYVPGIIAVIGAVYLYTRLADTPQSLGLPPVEDYKHDHPENQPADEDHEKELSLKELLVNYIIFNKYLWIFAIANFFVYIVRYSMLDWGPTYLKEAKGADIKAGGWGIFALEFGGIPSTILMGWLSDKSGGRRGMVSLLCMIPILFAFFGLQFNPPGNLWIDMMFLGIIGFFIYPPVMLLGVAALDLTSKKAVGTAAGFVGLFGYMGRTVQAKGLGWMAQHHGWDAVMSSIYIVTLIAIILLAFTWKVKPRG